MWDDSKRQTTGKVYGRWYYFIPQTTFANQIVFGELVDCCRELNITVNKSELSEWSGKYLASTKNFTANGSIPRMNMTLQNFSLFRYLPNILQKRKYHSIPRSFWYDQ